MDSSLGTSTTAPRIVREDDAAHYIGLSRSYLRAARLGRCDGPPHIQMGRAVRYAITDLDRWLDAHRVDRRARR